MLTEPDNTGWKLRVSNGSIAVSSLPFPVGLASQLPSNNDANVEATTALIDHKASLHST